MLNLVGDYCTILYSEVFCEADVFHLGASNFFYRELLLRRKWVFMGIMQVGNLEWHQLNLKFLQDHHFKTKYRKQVLEKEKSINEEKVKYILSFCE